jgi:hypothetical protein
MKTKFLLNLVGLSVLFLAACNFSVGTKKDLKTGLSMSYNGFSVDDVFLADGAGTQLSSNKIPLGSKFLIVANGVEHYTLKDGKAYPGVAITVKDKAGKIMGNIDDVLNLTNGLDPNGATVLKASLTLSPPFLAGNTYHVSVRFFDKQNAKNKITANADIELQ